MALLLVSAIAFSGGCSTRSQSSAIQFANPIASQASSFSRKIGSNPAADTAAARTAKKVASRNTIGLVSHQQDSVTKESESQAGDVTRPAVEADGSVEGTTPLVVPAIEPAAVVNQGEISLEQVLSSVTTCYPEIEIAIGEIQSANGRALATQGAFDDVFSGHSISQPLGFYQTYQNGVGITKPLFWGGELKSTYRIGDGNFEPWFGERETNEGGEFKVGFSLPLLKDLEIDKRRTELFAAELQRTQVANNVDARLLQFQRMATQSYWGWVASGRAIEIQQRLLDLAKDRVRNIEERIKEDDLAPIARIDNDRFIAKRKLSIIKANVAFTAASIKLSMFWRDNACVPVIAKADQLPANFPVAVELTDQQLQNGILSALEVRPELDEIKAQRQETLVKLQYARNLTLPKVDLKGFAGQDVGGETSSKGDKTPFELQLGVLAEVPLQRREGLGKIEEAQGKLVQLDAKLRFATDKIRAEVQDAAAAVNAAFRAIEQSKKNVELNLESLRLAKIQFEAGDIDLLNLNFYEVAVADAELELLESEYKYFFFRAIYETAIRRNAF